MIRTRVEAVFDKMIDEVENMESILSEQAQSYSTQVQRVTNLLTNIEKEHNIDGGFVM